VKKKKKKMQNAKKKCKYKLWSNFRIMFFNFKLQRLNHLQYSITKKILESGDISIVDACDLQSLWKQGIKNRRDLDVEIPASAQSVPQLPNTRGNMYTVQPSSATEESYNYLFTFIFLFRS